MPPLSRLSLTLLAILAFTLSSFLANPAPSRRRETNAERFSRGLGPAPPKRLYLPGRPQLGVVARDSVASTEPIPDRCNSWSPTVLDDQGDPFPLSRTFIIRGDNIYRNESFGYIPVAVTYVKSPVPERSNAACFKIVFIGNPKGSYLITLYAGETYFVFVQVHSDVDWSSQVESFVYLAGAPLNTGNERASIWKYSLMDDRISISLTDDKGSERSFELYGPRRDLLFTANIPPPDYEPLILLYPEPGIL